MYRFLIFLAFWGLFNLKPLYASCCSTSGSSGVGRLTSHEYALVQLNNIFAANLGYFDSQGFFISGTPKHLTYFSYQPQVHILARATNFLSPFITTGTQINKSSIRVGSGFSDTSMGARIILIKTDYFKYAPGVNIITQVLLPTGTRARAYKESRPEFITTTGDYKFNISGLLEKNIFLVDFALGYNFGFHFDKKNINNFNHQISLGSGFSPWVPSYVSGSINFNWQNRKTTITTAWTQAIHSHIKIILSSGLNLPIYKLGKNSKSQLITQLNMRFGVF